MKNDNRGQAVAAYQRNRSAEMKAAVFEYYSQNPLARVKECARDLGYSIPSVRKYIAALRAEMKGE